ncbi:sialidase family protein [Bacillus niameyensis]|uniref:sialidase family protein n=1 Tax=Bacillus niameyensis TaxID=1522308 RepID=UPI000782C8F5|nr:sialidase family protein [Bacillus niameyensis]
MTRRLTMSIQNTLHTYKIDPNKQIVIDREKGQYLGHPDSVLLDDDQTILTVYPKGHGLGEALLNKSNDGGKTWQGRTFANETWKDSRETPTIYKLDFNDGRQKLISISGGPGWGDDQFKGWKTSLSTNQGETWSDYKVWYEGTQTIVAMSSLVRLKDENGNWLDKWLGVYHNQQFINYKTYLSFSENGREQWSVPESLLKDYRDIEAAVQLCEACIFRSPDEKELVLIARSQSHLHQSTISFSKDEGNHWTEPRELPGSLNGERHKAAYDPISGRLFISFREIILDYNNDGKIEEDDWMAGDWVAWVGTYEDLVNGSEGEYRILLGEDFTPSRKSGDCGYAGIVVMQDGTFFLNSYGYFDKEEVERLGTEAKPYIMGVRFKLSEIK